MKLRTTFDVLLSIFQDGTYVNIALANLKDEGMRPFVTKVTYGVLEKYYEIDYVIGVLSDKQPKLKTRITLLEGIYCLKYTDMPDYAVCDEIVEICKKVGLNLESGYVNALLKKVASGEYPQPKKGDLGAKEVEYNMPYWIIRTVKADYPKAYKRILAIKPREEEHIRFRNGYDEKLLTNTQYQKTVAGVFAKNTPEIKKLNAEGKVTFQSLTSCMTVLAMGDVKGKNVLDLCSAPGGKSVFLAERGAIVTACDIHPHRTELVQKYAYRMGVKLNVKVNDGTKYNPQWKSAFDMVLVDAPCSGFGVLHKRRDIIFNRKSEDISALSDLQYLLLSTASKYVKDGGVLLYSTCTILKQENENLIAKFLEENKNFVKEKMPLEISNSGELQFLPDNEGGDGFYIARMINMREDKEC